MSAPTPQDVWTGQPEHRLGSSIGASAKSTTPNQRFSLASIETGESSKRISSTIENNAADLPDIPAILDTKIQAGRGSHRSHRSRGSASFLVFNGILEQPAIAADIPKVSSGTKAGRRDSSRDHKGKVTVKSPEKRHKKQRSSAGLGIEASILAATVANASAEHGEYSNEFREDASQDSMKSTDGMKPLDKPAAAGFDVESAQIVNLALNLSESRRNVARRNISSPVPPTITGFGEGFSGGSLRQHLQAQRRSSRNISPRPERSDRAFVTPTRLTSGQGPGVHSQVGSYDGGDYQYRFSASTLARAEKAKKALELMARYRELLQYLPPLKPYDLTRTSTRSPPNTAIGQPTSSGLLSQAHSTIGTQRQVGRSYNPLQYIRNRKVRARKGMTIDGESQGFGDVQNVASWVEQIAKDFTQDRYQASDCITLPPFVPADELSGNMNASPKSAIGGFHGNIPRVKRPRVDWITNPADMLADVYWLEQNDNKKVIEDNRERKIFPDDVGLAQPISFRGKELAQEPKGKEELHQKLGLDTKFSKFNPLRNSEGHFSNSPSQRIRQNLKSTPNLYENIQRNSHEHVLSKPHHSSSSDLSESEREVRRPKHRRNATADSHDLSSDILEKQMLEIIAKESRQNGWVTSNGEKGQHTTQPPRSSIPASTENLEKFEYGSSGREGIPSKPRDGQQRRGSRTSQQLPGRSSLEIPESHGRQSLDGLDITAPNSPQASVSNTPALFVPSIAIDLSPSSSRQSSPARQPTLAKVKSIINPFHDHSHNRSHSRTSSMTRENIVLEEHQKQDRKALDIPSTPDGSRRSSSPANQNLGLKTEDNMQIGPPKSENSRRKAEEPSSGIRGLFKGGRHSVQRVSDLIWKKEISSGSVVSSNTSSDDSDVDDAVSSFQIPGRATVENMSKQSSREASGEFSIQKGPRPYELPIFTSPFERRGRSGLSAEDMSPESDYASQRQRARQQRQLWRFEMLEPPRIDVQGASPKSSPDLPPTDRSSRNSDVSDLGSRQRRSLGVESADARLNSVLGIRGHVGHPQGQSLPITGLTHPQDSRRPSVAGKHHWSISDQAISAARGPMSKQEIARVQALLLSSGIKAKEISRLAKEPRDIQDAKRLGHIYADILSLNKDPQLPKSVSRSQAHTIAAQILSREIQLSSQMWQESASKFSSESINGLLDRMESLQDRIMGRDGLSELIRKAERDADEVSKDLVTTKTMAVKELLKRIDQVMRRRRRRFRWVRRVGWVAVEWALIGFMWLLWAAVMILTFLWGTMRGIISSVRWLLWL